MTRTKWLVVLWLAAAAASCAVRPPAVRSVPEDEGSAWIYLEPLPAGAERLEADLSAAAAVREDGTTWPLTLVLRRLATGTPPRERLLAWGPLPAGRYAGVALTFSGATLEGGEGPGVLQVQAEPVRVLFPFEAARRRAAVIALSLRFPESVGSGYRFAPAFAATGPRTLAIGLTGLASCRGAGVVMMFDRTSGSIVSVVPVGADPEGIAVDSGRFRGYVAVAGADRVEAIGLPEQVALDRVQLSGGDRPSELVLTPDGRRLLVVNSGSNTVSVLDARTLVEAKRISVGNGPSALVLDRTGRRAFVLNTLSDSVSFIDVRLPDEVPSAGALSYQPTVTIGVDAGPVRGALDRSGERLFVGHGPSPYLTVLDTKTLAVSRRVYVGTGAMAMTVDPRTDRLYLARRGAGGVEVFDPGSLLPVDFIRADGDVGDLVVDAEANTLFLALPEVNEVRAVTLIGKRSVVALDAGETPYRLALAGAR